MATKRKKPMVAADAVPENGASALDQSSPLIKKTPGVCGGQPTVAGTRVTVRGLEEARRAGFTDERLLDEFPFLRREQLVAAWKYVAAHPAEIERLIRENGA